MSDETALTLDVVGDESVESLRRPVFLWLRPRVLERTDDDRLRPLGVYIFQLDAESLQRLLRVAKEQVQLVPAFS